MPSEQKEFDEFIDAGLSPIPLRPGQKRPAISNWQKFCDEQANDDEIKKWADKYDLNQIGLALGTKLSDSHVLVAIDVDSNDILDEIWGEVGDLGAPAKIGAKGITIFCRADKDLSNTKIRRLDKNGKKETKPSVEILCHGSQTVVPPSIHPSTNEPYKWTTASLLNGFPDNLPLLDEYMLDAIKAICENKGDKLRDINEMDWAGVDGGGNTHDACVEAAAWMVSRGWTDAAIHSRIERAKKEAVERAGEEYNWPESTKTIQGWIDSARAKGYEEDGQKTKKKAPPAERVMAEWAIDNLGGVDNVVCERGILRAYENGHWPKTNTETLARRMYDYDFTLRKRDVENAISIIHTLMYDDHFGYTENLAPADDPKRKRVCLLNGTYDIGAGELIPHDRDHQVIHQLGFGWEDDNGHPLYSELIDTTFARDQEVIKCWNEFCGLTLLNDMSFQIAIFLKGPGGNGKGTVSRVLQNMHDPNAIGSVSITDLGDERKRTSLLDKLLNISGEQSRLNLVADTYFKKITGGDPVDIRKLYGETRNNVQFWVRFLELVNEMPQTSDTSHALRRRMRVLPTPNKVLIPDINLDQKLIPEYPAIFRKWVTEDIPRLYARGQFLNPEASQREVDQYMLDNDPVGAWKQERLDHCEKGTASSDLYADYAEWSSVNGYQRPYTSVFWGKRMNDLGLGPEVTKLHGKSIRIRKVKLKEGFGLGI